MFLNLNIFNNLDSLIISVLISVQLIKIRQIKTGIYANYILFTY